MSDELVIQGVPVNKDVPGTPYLVDCSECGVLFLASPDDVKHLCRQHLVETHHWEVP